MVDIVIVRNAADVVAASDAAPKLRVGAEVVVVPKLGAANPVEAGAAPKVGAADVVVDAPKNPGGSAAVFVAAAAGVDVAKKLLAVVVVMAGAAVAGVLNEKLGGAVEAGCVANTPKPVPPA